MPAHSHDRGSYDIWGTFGSGGGSKIMYSPDSQGAFYNNDRGGGNYPWVEASGNDRTGQIGFNASRHWWGVSQSIGSDTSHSHSFTGTQTTINHMNPYKVAYCFIRIN